MNTILKPSQQWMWRKIHICQSYVLNNLQGANGTWKVFVVLFHSFHENQAPQKVSSNSIKYTLFLWVRVHTTLILNRHFYSSSFLNPIAQSKNENGTPLIHLWKGLASFKCTIFNIVATRYLHLSDVHTYTYTFFIIRVVAWNYTVQ